MEESFKAELVGDDNSQNNSISMLDQDPLTMEI